MRVSVELTYVMSAKEYAEEQTAPDYDRPLSFARSAIAETFEAIATADPATDFEKVGGRLRDSNGNTVGRWYVTPWESS